MSMATETKTIETNQNKAKSNGTKPKQEKSVKDNPLFFEVPLPEGEALEWFTDGMRNKRDMNVTAVSGRYQDGRLMVGVLPDDAAVKEAK